MQPTTRTIKCKQRLAQLNANNDKHNEIQTTMRTNKCKQRQTQLNANDATHN